MAYIDQNKSTNKSIRGEKTAAQQYTFFKKTSWENEPRRKIE